MRVPPYTLPYIRPCLDNHIFGISWVQPPCNRYKAPSLWRHLVLVPWSLPRFCPLACDVPWALGVGLCCRWINWFSAFWQVWLSVMVSEWCKKTSSVRGKSCTYLWIKGRYLECSWALYGLCLFWGLLSNPWNVLCKCCSPIISVRVGLWHLTLPLLSPHYEGQGLVLNRHKVNML